MDDNRNSSDSLVSKKVDLTNFSNKFEKIEQLIVEAYQFNNSMQKAKIDWKLHKQIHQNICNALIIFADVTEQLSKVKQAKIKNINLCPNERKWIHICKDLLDALAKLTSMYTYYKDSLGMVNGNQDFFYIFKEAGMGEPQSNEFLQNGIDFSDVFSRTADILFDNGKIELARRFALISAIGNTWNGEWRDSLDALSLIYLKFYHRKQYDKAIPELIRSLKWLYSLYAGWQDQLATRRIINELQYDLITDWNGVDEINQTIIFNFLSVAINKEPYFDDLEYILSLIVERLVSSGQYDLAFKLVYRQMSILSKEPLTGHNFKLMRKMALLGFSLKDKNIESITKSNNQLKGSYLENKVCELAKSLGYREDGPKIWNYTDESLKKFIKNPSTKSVEIDVNKYKLESIGGKEKRLHFLAECKWKNKPSTLKDIEFFKFKIIDFIKQTTEENNKYPTKLAPKPVKILFVSINGFVTDALNKSFSVKGIRIELIDGKLLNELLAKHNVSLVHLDFPSIKNF